MLSIILSRRDFRENDQIVSLYTLERGKVEALARGVKKIISKNSAYLEPFFLVEAEIIPGKELNHLVKAQPISIFKNIRADLHKSLMAGYVMNLLEKFLQNGEKDVRVFNLIMKWLEFLDGNEIKSNSLIYSFIIKFLNLLGFKPEMDACVSCGKVDTSAFYFAGGGMVCAECGNGKKIVGEDIVSMGRASLADFVLLLNGNFEDIKAIDSDRVFRIIHRFAMYHSERKLVYFSQI